MFKIDAYFAKRYPNLTTVIASYLPLLKDNPAVIRAFTQVTGYTEAQFSKMVEFGAGPWVTPTRPDIYELGNPPPFQNANQYEPDGYEENLFLSGPTLDQLEADITKSLGNHDKKALSANIFVTSIMILHEAAHYAHYKTYGTGAPRHKDVRWGGTDKGFDFFRQVFQTDFTSPSFVDEAFDTDKAKSYANNNSGETHMFGLSHRNHYNGDKWIWDILRQVRKGQKGDSTLRPDDKKDKTPYPKPKPPCGCFGN